MSIAELLQNYRKRNKLSLRQAGRELGVSAKTILNLEEGKVLPSVPTLVALSSVLKIPISELVDVYMNDILANK